MATDPVPPLTADEWAALLQTRVLFANEFAGIAVSIGTPGWDFLDIAPIKKMNVDGLRRRVRKRGQEIVGILPEGSDHPMRVILKDVSRSRNLTQLGQA